MNQPPVSYNEHLKSVHVFADVFSADECRRLINLPLPGVDAEVDGSDIGRVDYRLRKTKDRTVPLSPDNAWIFRKLGGLINRVNPDTYRFQLNQVMTVHLLEYAPEGFFGWHVDLGTGGVESTRKLSMVTFLTPPEDYDGGGLCFLDGPEPVRLPPGNTIIFPSYLVHKVEPVTRGKRFTLVSWVHGPCFC